ncbi:EGF-containing fibulin-like extracellular matrix protein 2 isoform X2 [Watersipora subatra]|uniref:EGF-containing fibulin-like extracellular matrix protein 2 isoform X2 n=1 Tax=Watersipora subatra TaxID=2589382 RepID=UPI00355C8621
MAASCHTLLRLVAVLLLFTTTLAQLQLKGNYTDGRGISFCNKCGYVTDTKLPAANISQCVLEKADQKDISNSIFACQCRTHFTGDGITCNDVDECAEGTDDCDRNAYCINTVGSFDCSCLIGYRGTGVDCWNIDECAEARSEKNASDIYCNGRGECKDTDGSYRCKCDTGHVPAINEMVCVDIDECESTSTNWCSPNARCDNTIGSYTCTCNHGYTGNGYTCSEVSISNKVEGLSDLSALLSKYRKLNQERLQLVLKHDEILQRCAVQLQGRQLQTKRARREP